MLDRSANDTRKVFHGELRLKIVNAKQAELVHRYKNIQDKVTEIKCGNLVQQVLQV
jgi:hypothetical protein